MITALTWAGYVVAYLTIGLLGGRAVHTGYWFATKRYLTGALWYSGGKKHTGDCINATVRELTSYTHLRVSHVLQNDDRVTPEDRRKAAQIIWEEHLWVTRTHSVVVLLFWPVVLTAMAFVGCVALVVTIAGVICYYGGKGISTSAVWAFGPGFKLMLRGIDKFWSSAANWDMRPKAERVPKISEVSDLSVKKADKKVLTGEVVE